MGCTSFALLLAKTLDKSIYLSLNFGRKDASLSLDLEAPIYDLFDATNRGANLDDCIIKADQAHLLEAPLSKTREEMNIEGLKKVLQDLEETYDHIFIDLGPTWKDLDKILAVDEVFFLSSGDKAGLYAMDQVKFKNHLWADKATYLFTGVDKRDQLLKVLDQEGLSFDQVKTLPNHPGPGLGLSFSYPKEFARLYTEKTCMEIERRQKSFMARLLRG